MGVWAEFFPGRPKFSVSDIPDLTGRTAIVTGGNSGIGKETIKALLQHNATVFMAARSKEKAEKAIAELHKEIRKTAIFLELDLASLTSIEEAIKQFKEKSSSLHLLFNSGGVMNTPVEQLTSDGYDLQFGVNVLGHFYLTKFLLPTLIDTARVSDPGTVRIVNVSSFGHALSNPLDYKTLKEGPERIKLGTNKLYFQSKFGNVLLSNELAKRYGKEGIVSVSLNPGNIKTDINRHSGFKERVFAMLMCYPAPYGALTSLWAGTMGDGSELNGKASYLWPWARVGNARKEADDAAIGQKLWEWLDSQVEGR